MAAIAASGAGVPAVTGHDVLLRSEGVALFLSKSVVVATTDLRESSNDYITIITDNALLVNTLQQVSFEGKHTFVGRIVIGYVRQIKSDDFSPHGINELFKLI